MLWFFFRDFEVCSPPHLSPSKYVYPFVDIIFITIIYNIINAVCINRYICSLLKGCYDIEHHLSTSTWTLLFCRKSCSFYQKLSCFREQKKKLKVIVFNSVRDVIQILIFLEFFAVKDTKRLKKLKRIRLLQSPIWFCFSFLGFCFVLVFPMSDAFTKYTYIEFYWDGYIVDIVLCLKCPYLVILDLLAFSKTWNYFRNLNCETHNMLEQILIQ